MKLDGNNTFDAFSDEQRLFWIGFYSVLDIVMLLDVLLW